MKKKNGINDFLDKEKLYLQFSHSKQFSDFQNKGFKNLTPYDLLWITYYWEELGGQDLSRLYLMEKVCDKVFDPIKNISEKEKSKKTIEGCICGIRDNMYSAVKYLSMAAAEMDIDSIWFQKATDIYFDYAWESAERLFKKEGFLNNIYSATTLLFITAFNPDEKPTKEERNIIEKAIDDNHRLTIKLEAEIEKLKPDKKWNLNDTKKKKRKIRKNDKRLQKLTDKQSEAVQFFNEYGDWNKVAEKMHIKYQTAKEHGEIGMKKLGQGGIRMNRGKPKKLPVDKRGQSIIEDTGNWPNDSERE